MNLYALSYICVYTRTCIYAYIYAYIRINVHPHRNCEHALSFLSRCSAFFGGQFYVDSFVLTASLQIDLAVGGGADGELFVCALILIAYSYTYSFSIYIYSYISIVFCYFDN